MQHFYVCALIVFFFLFIQVKRHVKIMRHNKINMSTIFLIFIKYNHNPYNQFKLINFYFTLVDHVRWNDSIFGISVKRTGLQLVKAMNMLMKAQESAV